jgi:hypothetical protein
METRTYTAYTIKELKEFSESSFQSAYAKHLNGFEFWEIYAEDFRINSLMKELKYIGIESIKEICVNHGVNFKRNSDWKWDYSISFDPYALEGVRAYKWIMNEIFSIQNSLPLFQKATSQHSQFYKRRTNYLKAIGANGNKSRKSNIFFEFEYCPENCSMNFIFEKAIKDLENQLKNRPKSVCLEYFQNEVMGLIEKTIKDEYEYYSSEEHFIEECESNDYMFNEDGAMV